MINSRSNSGIPLLALVLVGLLFLPLAAAADFAFLGCATSAQLKLSNPHASWNMWAISPPAFEGRVQKCLNFCMTGQYEGAAKYVHATEGGFPHTYAAYANDNWCFCGGKLEGTLAAATESGVNKCGRARSAYQRGSSTGGGGGGPIDPPVVGPNQPPRAPTLVQEGWDPPFPVGYEGAIHLSFRNNGDPDGDQIYFYMQAWWLDAQANTWNRLQGRWVNEGNATLTAASGELVPNMTYAWQIAAVTAQVSTPNYAWSNFAYFRTVP